jgi:hypothetical protein
MTTENTLNDEIVDKTSIENIDNNSDALDASIEERVEEISKEEQLSQDLASEKDKFLRLLPSLKISSVELLKSESSYSKLQIKTFYWRYFLF